MAMGAANCVLAARESRGRMERGKAAATAPKVTAVRSSEREHDDGRCREHKVELALRFHLGLAKKKEQVRSPMSNLPLQQSKPAGFILEL